MGNSITDIPEIQALDWRTSLIRIPPELDVPLTSRVRQIIDTADFRRLSRISQLGLVSLVYPAAHHSRFEHSLGVYRLALIYLRHLSYNDRFIQAISSQDAELLIAAALLHDLGHWSFCHPIEDVQLPSVPNHELFANSFLLEGEIADLLRDEWGIQPRDVVSLLSDKPRDARSSLLSSILSGPIDIDKMDYLMRDSLHAGVPYGLSFDRQRLIGSLTVNEAENGLAITEKGRTAAEMMVFSRYVMFSEVYWHHAVRAATAMLQRAFYWAHGDLDLDYLFRLTEQEMIQHMLTTAADKPAGELLAGLFGNVRRLYKRVDEYTCFQNDEIYRQLARRPYPWLVACGDALAKLLSKRLRTFIAPHEILLDAPPIKREVEFTIDVYFNKEDRFWPLGAVSPVVKTLAQKQFDDYVKRVRIFVHPRIVKACRELDDLNSTVVEAIEQTD